MRKAFLNLLKIIPVISLIPVTATSCGSEGIVFANSESYMSDEIMQNLRIKHPNISFLPYETNEEIENKFARYYDFAVPSTYELLNLKRNDQLAKIDWTKFNIQKEDGSIIQNGIDAISSNIFSKTINTLITKLDQKYREEGYYSTNESILDYGIPYFLQSFSFAYKGKSIPELDAATNWETTFDLIDFNHPIDKRFTPSDERRIAVVSDARSVYGICNSISYDGVNPPEGVETIEDFTNIYSNLGKHFKEGYTYFNTDSGQIISTLAKHYPHGASSAIAYNGDLLYAAEGGGTEGVTDPNEFHFCKFDKTLIALDMVVLNKKDQSNSIKFQKMHDIVNQICLSGTSYGENIREKDGDEYKYDSMNNFSFVAYTSPLRKVCEYVMDENDSFFADDVTEDPQTIKLLQDIYNIDSSEVSDINYIEENISSELVKSNMHWAFNIMKGKL